MSVRVWVALIAVLAGCATFDAQGHPFEELCFEDGLHMTPDGYQFWTSIILPRLLADSIF